MSLKGSDTEILRCVILSELRLVPTCSTKIYCWGSGVGANNFRKIERLPVRLNLRKNLTESTIVSVAAGNRVSAFVTDIGKCYSWGENLLGRDCSSAKERCSPGEIQVDQAAVTQVVYGDSFCCMLSHGGNLHEFGNTPTDSSTNRQVRPTNIPKLKRFPRPIVHVACGQAFSIVLQSDGILRMTGTIGGIKPRRHEKQKQVLSSIPQSISLPESIQSVSCGLNHCVAVSSTGKCFSWGLAERLGLGPGWSGIITEPQMIDWFLKSGINIGLVACGATFTCVASSDSQRLFCFGDNTHLQCGDTQNTDMDNGNILYPKEIHLQGLSIYSIHCGFAHSAITTFSGKLVTWGFNDEGQLGLGHEKNIGYPTNVSFDNKVSTDCEQYVVSAACGRTHTICIVSNIPPSRFRERQEHLSCIWNSLGVLRRFFRFVQRKITHSSHNEEAIADNIAMETTVDISDVPALSVDEKEEELSSTISSEVDMDNQSINEPSSVCDKDDHYQSLIERLDMDREDKFSKAVEAMCSAMVKAATGHTLVNVYRQKEAENMQSNNFLIQTNTITMTRENDNQVNPRMNKLNEQIKKAADRLLSYRTKKTQQKDVLLKPRNVNIHTRKNVSRSTGYKAACDIESPSICLDHQSPPRFTNELLDNRRLRLLRKQELDKQVEELKDHINGLIQERRKLQEISTATRLIDRLNEQDRIFVGAVEKKQRQLKELQNQLNLDSARLSSNLDHYCCSTRVNTFKTLSGWSHTLKKKNSMI